MERQKARERRESTRRMAEFAPPISYSTTEEVDSSVPINLEISGEEAYRRRARLSGKSV